MGHSSDRPDAIRLAAAVLEQSLKDLAELLDTKFVRIGDAHDPERSLMPSPETTCNQNRTTERFAIVPPCLGSAAAKLHS